MDGWIAITVLVLIGLILIYLELIFVPGTTILGILGLVLSGIGIYMAYERHGTTAGSLVLVGSLLVTVGALIYSFKSRTWDKFALKDRNTAHVKEKYTEGLQVEMRGKAVSDLRPIGKAEFSGKSYEVKTNGQMIEAGEDIKIIRLTKNKIVVSILNAK